MHLEDDRLSLPLSLSLSVSLPLSLSAAVTREGRELNR